MTTRRTHRHAGIGVPGSRKTLVNVGAAAVVPPALKAGKVRCPVCRNAVSVNPTGTLRKHADLFGEPCHNRASGEATGITAPPVVIPDPRRFVAEPATNEAERVERPAHRSRLDVGSECTECGKWIPGERSLCGRCYATGRRSA